MHKVGKEEEKDRSKKKRDISYSELPCAMRYELSRYNGHTEIYDTTILWEIQRKGIYTTVRWAQRYEMTFSVFELCSLFYGYCFPFKSCNGYSNWMEFSWFFFFLLSLLELMRNGHRQLKVEVEPKTHLLYFKLTVIFLLTVHDIYPRLIFYMTSLFHDLYYFYY